MTPRRSLMRWATVMLGATTAAVFGLASPSWAVAVTINLSAYQGPSAGGNTITATVSTTTTTPTFVAGSVFVEFQQVTTTATTCSATYATPVGVTTTAGIVAVPTNNVTILTGSKIAITVPAAIALATGQTSAKYNVCVYSGTTVAATNVTGSPLIANQPTTTPYQIAAKPTITGVSPASGSSQGGQTITVTGTNFPSGAGALSATIGGTALTNISVASNGQSFTGTTPAHAPGGPLLLAVTTIGGTANTLNGSPTVKSNLYTYTNGITISPNTASNSRTGQLVDVLGVGFASMYFTTTTGTTPDDTNSHVYLVRGTYSPANNAGNKTVGETDECTGVLVISDTELICTLNLTTSYTNGSFAIAASRTVTDAVTTNTSTTLTSATANFTSNDVGLPITGTGIPASTTIASVTNPTTVVLSAAATATGTGVSVTVAPKTAADAATTASSTTLTSATIGFTSADVGRVISGTGIAPNTTISAVTDAQTVTLSQAATATGTGVSITVGPAAATPVGTYTLTVVSNGGIDVQPGGANADVNYTQSVISSGSTFTVAEY